jgi:hypothetical protein
VSATVERASPTSTRSGLRDDSRALCPLAQKEQLFTGCHEIFLDSRRQNRVERGCGNAGLERNAGALYTKQSACFPEHH